MEEGWKVQEEMVIAYGKISFNGRYRKEIGGGGQGSQRAVNPAKKGSKLQLEGLDGIIW